jgi:hypothetical protein
MNVKHVREIVIEYMEKWRQRKRLQSLPLFLTTISDLRIDIMAVGEPGIRPDLPVGIIEEVKNGVQINLVKKNIKFTKLFWVTSFLKGLNNYLKEVYQPETLIFVEPIKIVTTNSPEKLKETTNPAIKPQKPTKPIKGDINAGASLASWFVYFIEMKDNGFKYTLKDMSKEIGYSYSYVRHLYSNYRSEHL